LLAAVATGSAIGPYWLMYDATSASLILNLEGVFMAPLA
jgi:hypothetical protein